MKKAVIGALLVLLGFSKNIFSEPVHNELPVSMVGVSETVNWPNYEKDFALDQEGEKPYSDFVSNTLSRKHISELPAVLLGKSALYLDNLKNPTQGVVEFSLLGNKKVMRIWVVATPMGVAVKQVQLKIVDKWVSGKLGARPRISLLDPEKLLKDDVINGILISLESDDNGLPLELLLLSK